MKKLMVAMTMFVISSSASAQNVKEPEYNGQVAVLQEDSSLVVLQKEVAQMKTKTSGFGYIPIPGSSLLDKGKSCRVSGGNFTLPSLGTVLDSLPSHGSSYLTLLFIVYIFILILT